MRRAMQHNHSPQQRAKNERTKPLLVLVQQRKKKRCMWTACNQAQERDSKDIAAQPKAQEAKPRHPASSTVNQNTQQKTSKPGISFKAYFFQGKAYILHYGRSLRAVNLNFILFQTF